MPRFSVIIPTFNRADFILTAVNSVLKQTYRDLELIVADDGSTDSTKDILDSVSDPRLTVLRHDNRGVSYTRNRALKESSGDYIAFLDSDDRWLSRKLEVTEENIKKYPEINVFHTQEKWFRNGKHLNPKKKHMKKSGYIFENCLRICSVSISTAVIKREVFDETGFFREDLEVCEDYEFWLRVSRRNEIFLIDRILTEKEGGHADQLSLKYPAMDSYRIKAICGLMEKEDLSLEERIMCTRELERKCSIFISGCLKRDKHYEAEQYRNIINEYAVSAIR